MFEQYLYIVSVRRVCNIHRHVNKEKTLEKKKEEDQSVWKGGSLGAKV